jgi:hypothetical protein
MERIEMKKININGNHYSKEELRERSNKELIIENLIAIVRLEEHIKTQDEANNQRFNYHHKLIIGSIFGILMSFITIFITKLFI